MAEDRAEILANFQSITAIDDLEEAILHLDESNWDLLTAIHRVLPPENEPTHAPPPPISSIAQNQNFNNFNTLEPTVNEEALITAPSSPIRNIQSSSSVATTSYDMDADMLFDLDNPYAILDNTGASTSGNNDFRMNFLDSKPQDITIKMHFNNDVYLITISNYATVDELKKKISEKTNVPACRQAIKGWPIGKQRDAQNALSILKTLNVGNDTNLILTDLSAEGFFGETQSHQSLMNQTFTLHINLQPDDKMYVLKFPGKQTFLQIKTDVFSITSIPVRHQVWSGWPNHVTNETTLLESGINKDHNLVLKKAEETSSRMDTSSSSNRNRNNSSVIEIDSDSSVEEFEDATDFNNDDDYFAETPITTNVKHLLPDQIDDETIGSIQFVENYVERYGSQHPMFFQGSLEDALKEACKPSARDRKLLAIYLHHDASVLTHVFCGQLLSCESVIQTLLENYVIFGWDLTYESNKNMFLSSISGCIGVTASITVRNISVDKLPAIVVVAKSRSQCEVFQVIYGNVGVDDLLSQLISASEMYSDQLKIEMREENERYAREQMKMEQDEAYRESLEADRAKEALKQQQELIAKTERQRLESERAESEAKREMIRSKARLTVPPEPSADEKDVAKIRIRQPNGEMLERRFYADTKLQILLNFITAEGFLVDEFKVISGWPRRDLTSINTDDTLRQLKLFPQETVILEER